MGDNAFMHMAAEDSCARLLRCIHMAMGCLDPQSRNPDERLAWYRLEDAVNGKEPRTALTVEQQ